ncbi:hypothetical protein PC110_g16438 [Phytophthora cactorum]|uniref:Uncharacterized protein n=1 Tax=Phytophthora cactorum TaxID=29920 RepID=A0A329RUW4_9STRA|nr:hypothetical protein PC112_g19282 [Phytophthora cactorum]KAG2832670.1 hypothetical protein PC113_g20706 [Phytophthora cactorum]KAG2882461.1 hypothetical protein PC114_g21030 [Phytophthora cactorum]KAG2907725.1 hypothetical protein PC117_g20145 [Phytophthora cactorum]KAG2984037.1 hypothetical protein PC119_g20491 [Phytophthora cactorum]
MMANGTSVCVNWAVKLSVRLQTIAGNVHVAEPVECLIIPGDSGEFLLGNDMLLKLGIDVERQLDILAVPLAADKNEDEFDDADEPTIGGSVQHEEDVRDGILQLVKEVIADGFPWEFEKELTRIALRFDLWRTRLGADPPAKATPMRIRLKHGANPYRCKAKKYPPEVHRFMDDFNSKPVELGWYMTIVRGGGHAPHYQYVKVVGAFDRQQTTRQ